MCRGADAGCRRVCQSNVVIVDDDRRQTVPLCAHRQTQYLHAYTSRSSSLSLHVTRQDGGASQPSRTDSLYDVRKYTHLLHITGSLPYAHVEHVQIPRYPIKHLRPTTIALPVA